MDRLVETIAAVGEDGQSYRVELWEKQVDTSTVHSTGKLTEPGRRAYKLEDGTSVNRKDDDTFVIASTGVVLRRIVSP